MLVSFFISLCIIIFLMDQFCTTLHVMEIYYTYINSTHKSAHVVRTWEFILFVGIRRVIYPCNLRSWWGSNRVTTKRSPMCIPLLKEWREYPSDWNFCCTYSSQQPLPPSSFYFFSFPLDFLHFLHSCFLIISLSSPLYTFTLHLSSSYSAVMCYMCTNRIKYKEHLDECVHASHGSAIPFGIAEGVCT